MVTQTSRITALGLTMSIALCAHGGTAVELGGGDRSPVNWEAPPYWTPPPAADPAAGRESLIGRSALAVSTTPLPFIALPPCRVVDTRGNAPLTGGFLPPATVRSYTVTGVCGIPANAQALSLNATVVKPTGPGFLTLWPEGGTFPPVSTLNYVGGDVITNAAVVPLSGAGGVSMALGVSGGDVILDTNGYYASVPAVTSLNALTGALSLTGSGDVVVTPGVQALQISTNATSAATPNTLVRRDASGSISASVVSANAAFLNGLVMEGGSFVDLQGGQIRYNGGAFLHTRGDQGTICVGVEAGGATNLILGPGSSNTALGYQAAFGVSGNDNVAVGYQAESNLTTGSNNVAVGYQAGINATTGNNNVYLANPGPAFVENNTIRIGAGGTHLAMYLAGVRGVTTAFNNALPVLIDSSGQLGTASSSIRFKKDVSDLGDEVEALARLRPVTFRYKTEAPGSDPHFGLIAEEVEGVLPALVVRDGAGAPESVKYHELPALLLGAIQRQGRVIDEQRKLIEDLRRRIEALEAR